MKHDIQIDRGILEIYKLSVEMADRISARRVSANAFFITINTTLVAFIGIQTRAIPQSFVAIPVCFAGILVSICWWFLLRNYRRLNEAKFKVINRLEAEYLPVTPFSNEWEELGQNNPPKDRRSKVLVGLQQLGTVERAIPIIFGVLHVVLLMGGLFK